MYTVVITMPVKDATAITPTTISATNRPVLDDETSEMEAIDTL